MEPRFSILVVCLNAGKKLEETLRSIQKQSCRNYEVIVKDGGSTDGSLACVEKIKEGFPSFLLVQKKDGGIYDAMNQAVFEAKGSYLYFLNCGDLFYDRDVLLRMEQFMKENKDRSGIYYGNIFESLTGQQVASNPRMNAFGCYRNVPCHQACFYERGLLLAHPFLPKYKVRADYEQFLWCFLKAKAKTCFADILIARYEGGGFSETKENKKLSAREHKEITGKYMNRFQILWYRLLLCLTLAPLRSKIAENEKTAGMYNRLKKRLYGRR